MMEEPASTASLEAAAPPADSGARWDRTAGTAAAVVRLEGTLEAVEPLHIGGAQEDDPEDVSDVPLLTDPLSGRPLLPGATLAGALRSYLDAREHGFPEGEREEKRKRVETSHATAIFGGRDVENPAPSMVMVDDALGRMPEGRSVEVYEGNRLAGATRTTEKGALYSRTVWPAGTTFDLHFEMELPVDEKRTARLCTALVSALRGLEDDERAGVRLGGRKRRGFGRVRAEGWLIRCFDLAKPEGLLSWVEECNEPLDEIRSHSCTDVTEVRDVLAGAFGETNILPDARKMFFVEADCTLPHGVLDRTSGMTGEPDVAHRRAYDADCDGEEDGKERPVLTGTQMGGALRARATRIAHTLAPDPDDARALVEAVFGSEPDREEDELRAGRLWIDRSFIAGDRDAVDLMGLVQNRIQIAPWRQAPAHGALFNEQPVRGGDDVEVTLRWRLDRPEAQEIGLLLHLLKDLWLGDQSVAGTQSIGRGQFSGQSAALKMHEEAGSVQSWRFVRADDAGPGLRFTDGAPEDFDRYAAALRNHLDETNE